MSGWDFKSYVLGILFYRFSSENLTAYLNVQERSAGDASFDDAVLLDAKHKARHCSEDGWESYGHPPPSPSPID